MPAVDIIFSAENVDHEPVALFSFEEFHGLVMVNIWPSESFRSTVWFHLLSQLLVEEPPFIRQKITLVYPEGIVHSYILVCPDTAVILLHVSPLPKKYAAKRAPSDFH